MRVVLQRSKSSFVKVKGRVVGSIKYGLVILVGFSKEDDINIIDKMIDKIINIRIFDDESKIMNKSILDIKGEILSVSQFTLYASTAKGRRPSYQDALESTKAKELYEVFNEKLRNFIKVETGIFQEDMEVSIVNDGPVTIVLEN